MDGASGGGKDCILEKGCVDDTNDNNSTQVREEDDACSEVETEGALASSEGYSADYSESISSGSSSSSDRRECRDTMGHTICINKNDGGDDTADVKGTQKKLDAASPSRDDPHNGQQQNKNNAHHAKRRHSASNIEQNTHRHRHHHNKELDMNRQMDEIMNLYNVR